MPLVEVQPRVLAKCQVTGNVTSLIQGQVVSNQVVPCDVIAKGGHELEFESQEGGLQ